MRFSKTAASILAAAMAVSALSVSALAEENKIRLITAEIPAELATSMVFFDGVGVVDITGVGYDSSENVAADKDANLDVNFDGLGYVGEKNLEAWRDTGVLTFSKLKADFDTKGLQWGMFVPGNNYVQLVKRNGDEVTERALYKVTDGELKKLHDLDTFWTYTRKDGISVGVETVNGKFRGEEGLLEVKVVVTQPDGTRSVKNIAKANVTNPNITVESTGAANHDSQDSEYYIGYDSRWACPDYGDTLIGIGIEKKSLTNFDDMWDFSMTDSIEIKRYYMDGSEKEIFKSKDPKALLYGLGSFESGNIAWELGAVALAYGDRYFYNNETGETAVWKAHGDYAMEEMMGIDYYHLTQVHWYGDKIIGENGFDNGWAIFDNADDLTNCASKTYYKKITDCGDNVYLYETLDGKKGYMDGDEKVLAEFDDAEEFSAKYAPVVKDGKAYLVDKQMNVVSEQIDADSVSAVSDNIFIVNKGDKKYFATFEGGKADDTPSTPDKPSTPAVLVDYSDDSTGIKASADEGVIADGAKLSVAAVADKTDDKNFTYEISFKKDDKEVQPNGKVTVKIPVPEAIKDKTIYVYRVEDGKYYDMGAKVENGFVVFETDHFSEYLVTTEKNENAAKPSNPATGIPSGMLGIAAIAGAVVIVSKKRK